LCCLKACLHYFIDRSFDELTDRLRYVDSRIVAVNLAYVARTVLAICPDADEYVAVGNSAKDVTQFFDNKQIIEQQISTIRPTQDRRYREVSAAAIPESSVSRCFVDDVAVSGSTLDAALKAAASVEGVAVAGLAWNSRRLRKKIPNLRSAVVYEQEQGGTPRVNTLKTLVNNSTLRYEYAEKLFGSQKALEEVSILYSQGE
jgi:hypothetical protein